MRRIAHAERYDRLPAIVVCQPAHGSAEHRLNTQFLLAVGALAHLVERLEGQPLRGAPQVNTLPISTALQPLPIVHPVPDGQNAKGRRRRHGDLAHEAGLAKGTVFLYFRTKEEIFLINRPCQALDDRSVNLQAAVKQMGVVGVPEVRFLEFAAR